MNIFKKLHKNYILNKYAKEYGFKRRESIFKDALISKMSIENYFKECWFVREVKIIEDKKYFAVDINIKSWFPLSSKILSEFKERKSYMLYTKIHNEYLFGKKEYKL